MRITKGNIKRNLEENNEEVTELRVEKIAQLRHSVEQYLIDLSSVFELDAELEDGEEIGLTLDCGDGVVLERFFEDNNHRQKQQVMYYSLDENTGEISDTLMEKLFSKKYIDRLEMCLTSMSVDWKKNMNKIMS